MLFKISHACIVISHCNGLSLVHYSTEQLLLELRWLPNIFYQYFRTYKGLSILKKIVITNKRVIGWTSQKHQPLSVQLLLLKLRCKAGTMKLDTDIQGWHSNSLCSLLRVAFTCKLPVCRLHVHLMTRALLHTCRYIWFDNKMKEIKILGYSEPKYKLWNWHL